MEAEGLTLFGFGSLHINGKDEPFAFQPYELSQHSIGLVIMRSFFDEALGKSIVMKTPVGHFPLTIESFVPMTSGPDGLCRGRFRPQDIGVNFERQLGPIVNTFKAQGHSLQAVRFPIHDPTLAVAKTFGSGLNYPLQIKNISKSGILLTSDIVNAAPFQINSLIELQFLSQNDLITQSFDCLAKVVRIENKRAHPVLHSSLPQGYGAKFIDLHGNLEHEIDRLVAQLEAGDSEIGAA